MDYAALARELGGTLAPAPKAQPQKFNVPTDSGRNVEVDVRFPTAEESTTAAPQPVDMQALAAELGGTISAASQPETTATGLAGAATRGLEWIDLCHVFRPCCSRPSSSRRTRK